MDHGAVPVFVALLASPSDDVREQAVWALGNIAGDSPRCRDTVLTSNALMPLLGQLNAQSKLTMLRNSTWTLSNFCRGKPQPHFDLVRPALPALAQLVTSTDEEVLTDACWALSYLSDGTNDKIAAVIDAGVCGRLVELLGHPSPSVLIPALRTVGNIVTGDDVQTQIIINCAALPCLLRLLTESHKKSIKKEACWTISNITAGNKDQIQSIIDAGIIPPLVALLSNAEFDIKKEAAWALSNATSGGTHPQIRYLVQAVRPRHPCRTGRAAPRSPLARVLRRAVSSRCATCWRALTRAL
jgi:HEAT repeat protein